MELFVDSSKASQEQFPHKPNPTALEPHKKLHLVLDLDKTLLHSINAEDYKSTNEAKHDDVYKILEGEIVVKLRPGARDFLRKAYKMFDLSIYTMADKPYAYEIANILEEPGMVRFTRVISKERCTKMYKKSLEDVFCDRQLALIVDDEDEVWCDEDRENVIKIQDYTFFDKAAVLSDDDDELARVLDMLEVAHEMFSDVNKGDYFHDVRRVLEKVMMISFIIRKTEGLMNEE